MDEGTSEGPFEEPTRIDGPGQQVRYVIVPPRPPLPGTTTAPPAWADKTDTEPLNVIPDTDEAVDAANRELDDEEVADYALMRKRKFRNGASPDGSYYRTRRHWREPWLRLLRPESNRTYEHRITRWEERIKKNPTMSRRQPERYGPIAYAVTVYGAFLCMVVSALLYFYQPETRPVVVWTFPIGAALLAYSIARERYRWSKRTILARHTESGLRITYGEPDNILFGFNGNFDGHVRSIEGSNELTPLISWPNKLIFWGCGDLDVSSKVEAGGPPVLDNIPRARRVHTFLSRGQ